MIKMKSKLTFSEPLSMEIIEKNANSVKTEKFQNAYQQRNLKHNRLGRQFEAKDRAVIRTKMIVSHLCHSCKTPNEVSYG